MQGQGKKRIVVAARQIK